MKALKTATMIGIPPSEFWEMTMLEFKLSIQSYNERKMIEYKDKIALAYMTAMWTAQFMFGKQKPPKLEKILDDIDPSSQKTMTEEEMFREVKRLNAMFGGEIKISPRRKKVVK